MTPLPAWLALWLTGGHAILLIIGLIIVEGLLIAALLRRRAIPILVGLLPGLCLAGALLAALTGAGALWIGLCLTLSLPAHLADLRYRVRSADRR